MKAFNCKRKKIHTTINKTGKFRRSSKTKSYTVNNGTIYHTVKKYGKKHKVSPKI